VGFIDTHSHIYGPEFADDIDEVIQRAKAAGVQRILLPNINMESIAPMLSLWQQHPDYLSPMMGLHPEDVTADYQSVLDHMHSLLTMPGHPYIAVGEVGLDYYWDKTYYTEQQDAFTQQIEWAKALDLPLMIHTRGAHQEMVDIMSRYADGNLRGVFHCFGGTRDEAEQLLRFDGFVLGIGGVLTYKKSTLPEALQDVPLSRIVIETDAPYLAPVPMRGKRNESSFALHTVNKLAELYQVTPEEVMNQTNANVKRVFNC